MKATTHLLFRKAGGLYSCPALGSNLWRMQKAAQSRKEGGILFSSICVCQGEMTSSGVDCPRKESFSSESLTKARVRAPNPSKSQETAKTFKLQIGLCSSQNQSDSGSGSVARLEAQHTLGWEQ